MKHVFLLAIFTTFFFGFSKAQNFRGPDKSPMDMAYFPDNFAHDRKKDEKAMIRVVYSRPQKNGREVFGKLVPFGEVWRTGANEATEIKFSQDVEFAGKHVKAGTYSLFTIPYEKQWTIILNSDLDYWGESYKASSDVVRVTTPTVELSNPVEYFTIQFESKGNKEGVMKLAWDKTSAEVPFKMD